MKENLVNDKTNFQTCFKLYIDEYNVQNCTFTIEFCQIVVIVFEIFRKYVIHIRHYQVEDFKFSLKFFLQVHLFESLI
jgi:hypothetical protein